MMLGRNRASNDQGETLVEVLVAVAILGLAGVAVLVGMGLAAKASRIHRAETTGSAQLRSYAEDIQQTVTNDPTKYTTACANQATAYLGSAVGFSTPTGFNDPTYTIQSIGQNSSGQVINVGCGSTDVGLQKLTLSMASKDGSTTETLAFVLRRPCDTNAGTACS